MGGCLLGVLRRARMAGTDDLRKRLLAWGVAQRLRKEFERRQIAKATAAALHKANGAKKPPAR
jgi:hypothetical protein